MNHHWKMSISETSTDAGSNFQKFKKYTKKTTGKNIEAKKFDFRPKYGIKYDNNLGE